MFAGVAIQQTIGGHSGERAAAGRETERVLPVIHRALSMQRRKSEFLLRVSDA